MFCCSNIVEWDYQSFTQALKPLYSEDGTKTKRLEITIYKCFLDFLEICNFDGMSHPRPQSNFKKIALGPHDFAGNFYLI